MDHASERAGSARLPANECSFLPRAQYYLLPCRADGDAATIDEHAEPAVAWAAKKRVPRTAISANGLRICKEAGGAPSRKWWKTSQRPV